MDWRMETPLGPMVFREENGAVTALRFAAEGECETLPPPASELSLRAEDWLRRYFAGDKPTTELPFNPAGTAFQRRVWQAACAIPYGETVSYGQLASQIGCASARAVGAALGKNPIWLLIPCHRVIGADGSLTGYAGGLEKKAALLALEKRT